ncbi:hypothetical protein Tco_1397817 [Tanacetum coccineum]
MAAATKALIVAVAAALPSSPLPSLLTPLSSSIPQIPSPPLPLPSPPTHTSPTYVEAILGCRAAMIRLSVASPPIHHPSKIPSPPLFEVGESSAAAAARQLGSDVTPATDNSFVDTIDATPGHLMSREVAYGITDTWDELVDAIQEIASATLEGDAQDDRALLRSRVNMLFRDRRYHLHTTMLLESKARHAWQDDKTREPDPARALEHSDGPSDVGSSSQGVATALAEYEATRSRNGDNTHDSGTGRRRQMPTTRECTYSDFLKCQPLNFKGTKRVKTLMKMMTGKYYPMGEIKKLEIEIWNLKVKGTDVISYTQRFQELALLCWRMFLEELDEV